MKIIDYDPGKRVPPILESDVLRKMIVIEIKFQDNGSYIGIMKKESDIIKTLGIKRKITAGFPGTWEWYRGNLIDSMIRVYHNCYRPGCFIQFIVVESWHELTKILEHENQTCVRFIYDQGRQAFSCK